MTRLLAAAARGRGAAARRNPALILTLAGTGAGVGETLALAASDLDLATRRLRVRGRRDRVLAIPARSTAALQAWLDERAALGIEDAPLFCTGAGAPLEPSYVRRLLTRLGVLAEIAGPMNARALRESFIATRLAGGATPQEVQAELGHASPAAALRRLRAQGPRQPADGATLLAEGLVDIAHCGLVVIGARRNGHGQIADFVFEVVNPAGAGVLRRSPQDVIGHSVSELFPDSPANGVFERWRRLIAEQDAAADPDAHYDMEDGSRWFRVRRRATGDRILLSFDEHTSRKRAEREHALTAARERAVQMAAAEAVIVLDPEGRIVSANQATERLSGVPRERLVGRFRRDSRWEIVDAAGEPYPASRYPSLLTAATGRPNPGRGRRPAAAERGAALAVGPDVPDRGGRRPPVRNRGRGPRHHGRARGRGPGGARRVVPRAGGHRERHPDHPLPARWRDHVGGRTGRRPARQAGRRADRPALAGADPDPGRTGPSSPVARGARDRGTRPGEVGRPSPRRPRRAAGRNRSERTAGRIRRGGRGPLRPAAGRRRPAGLTAPAEGH